MQALRNARLLARLVLAWFALFVGVAVATPLVKPERFDLVCSAGSVKLLAKADASAGGAEAVHVLDCPLCLPLDVPPAAPVVRLPAPQPQGHALQPIPAARIAGLTAAPLPARGPPRSLLS